MKLKNKISIYIPSTVNINQKTDNSEKVKQTEIFLSGLFGGCTSFKACGNWISNNNQLVKEEVTIVYAFCDSKQFRKSKKQIIQYCEKLCAEMSQEAISLEINRKLTFVVNK